MEWKGTGQGGGQGESNAREMMTQCRSAGRVSNWDGGANYATQCKHGQPRQIGFVLYSRCRVAWPSSPSGIRAARASRLIHAVALTVSLVLAHCSSECSSRNTEFVESRFRLRCPTTMCYLIGLLLNKIWYQLFRLFSLSLLIHTTHHGTCCVKTCRPAPYPYLQNRKYITYRNAARGGSAVLNQSSV